jgi:hypothetical protein
MRPRPWHGPTPDTAPVGLGNSVRRGDLRGSLAAAQYSWVSPPSTRLRWIGRSARLTDSGGPVSAWATVSYVRTRLGSGHTLGACPTAPRCASGGGRQTQAHPVTVTTRPRIRRLSRECSRIIRISTVARHTRAGNGDLFVPERLDADGPPGQSERQRRLKIRAPWPWACAGRTSSRDRSRAGDPPRHQRRNTPGPWLVTVVVAAAWRSESAVRCGDQAGWLLVSQAACRARSALAMTAS